MTVLIAIKNMNTMSYEEIRMGFENVKVGVASFFAEEHSVSEIRNFLEEKFELDMPYFVENECEYYGYVRGYAKCLLSLVKDGVCCNKAVSISQATSLYSEVYDYVDVFAKIVTKAMIKAYNHKFETVV